MRRYGTIGIVIALLLLVAGLVPARPAVGQSTTCKIIFRSNRGGSYGLWVYHIDSDTFEQVNYEDSYSPSWNPDGTRFAFWLDNDVYTSKYDGTDRQTIYDASNVFQGSVNWMQDNRVSFWAINSISHYRPFVWDGTVQEYVFSRSGNLGYAENHLLDCDNDGCAMTRYYNVNYPHEIIYNNASIYSSTSVPVSQAVIWGSKIYYGISGNINRMDTEGNNDEIFVNGAEHIRFSNGWYTLERSNEIYYSSDGGPTLIQITNDAYDDSQPDIHCGSPPPADPTPTSPSPGGGDDGGTGVISGDISITIPDIDIGYTLPTATANLTATDTPDYQGAMRSIADGASALFDFSEPPAQLLTTLILVVVLTQLGMFIKAFARWRHGR